jgi:hypothetical protein
MPTNTDKRPARFTSDVVKTKGKPLSGAQIKVLIMELRKAYTMARLGGEERSFDLWRAWLLAQETAGHRAGQIAGLTEAKNAHFKAIMAAALQAQGKYDKALAIRIEDTPEADRKGALLHLIRETLAKLPPLNEGDSAEAVAAMRQGYGDTLSRKLFRCEMANADANQLDYLYRALKPAVTEAANTRRAALVKVKAAQEEGGL